MAEQTPPKEPESAFRGLYRYVKIDVKTLDKIILGGIIALVILLAYGISHNGYTISFDSHGGTDVPSQSLMYGDLVAEPEPPTREGYTFGGWFKDENCTVPWIMQESIVCESITLHAHWLPNAS